eukprot:CAMPEP_0118655934 /NCGR_PEP_ID=MMETSP0785-20121206/13212_1 /TAXON_ID=91992 /ORGANISM="Bolidomonas pacifica, Strain CCMP 1866" /LENGTH=176 /DNA_ID=CAMNT_0006548743 /DNA_START=28 /DNA_END=558 /DNA_ORIENTATION=+
MASFTASTATTIKPSSTGGASVGGGESVTKRLQQELMGLMMQPSDGVSAFPSEDNMFIWTASLTGPPSTPYSSQSYKLNIAFPADYPYTAPTIKFTTGIWHPNIDLHGNICLDILKEKWSAAYSIRTVLVSLRSLLGEPNNDSPLNVQAAGMWDDQKRFAEVAKSKWEEEMAKEGA